MGLNKSKGNMYPWVDYTWNTIKGQCYHDCVYCYMKSWGELPKIHFDEKELKTDLGQLNTIFVGNSNDIFADNIPSEWILKTIHHCWIYSLNTYVFQTKNLMRLVREAVLWLPERVVLGTTIETNRDMSHISKAPHAEERADLLAGFKNLKTFVTIEPILDFDVFPLYDLIRGASPDFINIGADSKGHKLQEPPYHKIELLLDLLKDSGIEIRVKHNLTRLKDKNNG